MDILLTIILGTFFLVIFPLGELARIDLANNIAISGIDVGVGILFILFLITLLLRRIDSGQARVTNKKLAIPICFFLIVCLVSLLINIPHLKITELLVSFLYLLRFAGYASLYFLVRLVPQSMKQKISFMMIGTGVVLLLIGYVQYFFYPSLRNLYYLGWDVHLYRMFSSFLDPNFFGAFLVLYFLFILSFLFSKEFKNRKGWLLVFITILLCTLIAIVLTYSRSAYLMFVTGLIIFFVLKKPSKHILYGIIILFFVAVASYFVFTKYSEGTNLLRKTSTEARLTSSQNALSIFEKNPIVGVGFNAYRYAQNRYGLSKKNEPGVTIDHSGAGTDNSFLFVLATTGVIGFIAYMYLLWNIVTLGRHILHKQLLAPTLIASVVALCIDSFFINSLFYPFILVWLWFVVAQTEA